MAGLTPLPGYLGDPAGPETDVEERDLSACVVCGEPVSMRPVYREDIVCCHTCKSMLDYYSPYMDPAPEEIFVCPKCGLRMIPSARGEVHQRLMKPGETVEGDCGGLCEWRMETQKNTQKR